MVALGRRIARSGRERGSQAVSERTEWPEPESQRSTGATHAWRAVKTSGVCRIGALRGVPARMGRTRRRLERGESPFPETLFECEQYPADRYRYNGSSRNLV